MNCRNWFFWSPRTILFCMRLKELPPTVTLHALSRSPHFSMFMQFIFLQFYNEIAFPALSFAFAEILSPQTKFPVQIKFRIKGVESRTRLEPHINKWTLDRGRPEFFEVCRVFFISRLPLYSTGASGLTGCTKPSSSPEGILHGFSPQLQFAKTYNSFYTILFHQ